jgi:hypothetical protein
VLSALYLRVVTLPLLNLDYYGNFISELMVKHLDGSMVSTHDGRADVEATQQDGHCHLRRPWLKSSHQSVSQGMNKLSCYAAS